MNLKWYKSHGRWNCKVPVPGDTPKSFASGIMASAPKVKWRYEKKDIREEAYRVVMHRVKEEGLTFPRTGQHLTFREWSEEYLETVSPLKKSHKDDVSRFRVINEYFGDYSLKSISEFDLLRFRKLLQERALPSDAGMKFNNGSKEKRANTTVNRYMEHISSIFTYAELRPPRVKKLPGKRRSRTYELWEIDAILSSAKEVDEEFRRLVIFAFNSGLRQGNIMALRWDIINLDIGEVYHPDSKSGEPLTSYLNEESKRVLLEQKVLYPDREKVWRWKEFPRKYWTRTLEKAGVKDCWFHDIRHHVVTEVANSHGIHIAKEVAHHKSISTTEIYVNPSKNQVKEAIRGLSSTNRKVVPWSTKSLPFQKPETFPDNKKARRSELS
ncbi:MAG TPA: tyrosine-type recombinase/integrase [candidate division Zixibacteria bacterium]|nr:tyrosine-type recombinase/integrase [candidate division Zixibacteria bacterium]